jgi:hypothetical protein
MIESPKTTLEPEADADCPLAKVQHEDSSISNPLEIFSLEELDTVLDSLIEHSPFDAPWMAHITRANGDTVSVGLGRPLILDSGGEASSAEPQPDITVFSWVQADGMPPYYWSRGGRPASGRIVFFIDGHWTEFFPQAAIDIPTARRTLHEFIAGSGLPKTIGWEVV